MPGTEHTYTVVGHDRDQQNCDIYSDSTTRAEAEVLAAEATAAAANDPLCVAEGIYYTVEEYDITIPEPYTPPAEPTPTPKLPGALISKDAMDW